MPFDKKLKIRFKLRGININLDEGELEKSVILNEFNLDVHSQDSINEIKRRLSLLMLEKQEAGENVCRFCFKNTLKEIVRKKKQIKKPKKSSIQIAKKDSLQSSNLQLDDYRIDDESDDVDHGETSSRADSG